MQVELSDGQLKRLAGRIVTGLQARERSRQRALALAFFAGLGSVVYGIALVSAPAAWILGGVLGSVLVGLYVRDHEQQQEGARNG